MPAVDADDSLEAIELALTTIVRQASLPRLQSRILREADVAMDQATYPLLRRLASCGPVRITELARAMNIDVSTASRQIKQLEAIGFVLRSIDADDRRASVVALARPGVQAMERVGIARREMLHALLAKWSDPERKTFALLLSELATGITEYGEGRH